MCIFSRCLYKARKRISSTTLNGETYIEFLCLIFRFHFSVRNVSQSYFL